MVDPGLRLMWLVEIYYDTIHTTQCSGDRAESIAFWWHVPAKSGECCQLESNVNNNCMNFSNCFFFLLNITPLHNIFAAERVHFERLFS